MNARASTSWKLFYRGGGGFGGTMDSNQLPPLYCFVYSMVYSEVTTFFSSS